MAYYGGTVTIQPKAAKLTHDTAIFQMDPYCVVWLGDQSARTAINTDGGRHPHWTDVLTLFRRQEDSLRFLIYDSDNVEADSFVAEGHFHFNTYQGGVFEEWIPLHYKGKPAGELHINIAMQPGPAQGYPQAYPQQGYIPVGPGGYQQPVAEVIIEEERGRHHQGFVEEKIIVNQSGQQIPQYSGQVYQGQQPIYGQHPPGQAGYRPY